MYLYLWILTAAMSDILVFVLGVISGQTLFSGILLPV